MYHDAKNESAQIAVGDSKRRAEPVRSVSVPSVRSSTRTPEPHQRPARFHHLLLRDAQRADRARLPGSAEGVPRIACASRRISRAEHDPARLAQEKDDSPRRKLRDERETPDR